MARHPLQSLLDLASVAVIGDSDKPASVGCTVWRNLLRGRPQRPLFAVNPKYQMLDGRPVAA